MTQNEHSTSNREAEHGRWRERRLRELTAPESWLGLVGLYWLEPGRNTVGSAPGSAVPMPEGPSHLGDLLWEGTELAWRPAPGSNASVQGGEERAGGDLVLRTDIAGEVTASRVRSGDLVFFVIEREGRLAVRLRDLRWNEKRSFTGVDCYPFDPAWRLEATWQELAQPVTMEVPNVTGELKPVMVRWKAVFQVEGKEISLLPLEVGDSGVFFVLRDATSGRETYGGGRFLRAKLPEAGRLILDFNRAYNPPCAFTPFATCPLPPPENWLPIPIRAGEKKYAGGY